MSIRSVVALALVSIGFPALTAPSVAHAQSGTVGGAVHDSLGNPLERIEIAVLPAGPFAFTDKQGRYNLRGIPNGEHRVIARRIGFIPELADIELTAPGGTINLDFTIARIPPLLAEQIVSARRERLADVYARMDKHLGKTLFSEDLERFRQMNFDDVVRFSSVIQSQLFAPKGCGKPIFFVDGRLTPPKNWEGATIGDFVTVDDIAAVEAFKSPDFVLASFLADNGALADNTVSMLPVMGVIRGGEGILGSGLLRAGSCQRIMLIWTKHYVTLRARAIDR